MQSLLLTWRTLLLILGNTWFSDCRVVSFSWALTGSSWVSNLLTSFSHSPTNVHTYGQMDSVSGWKKQHDTTETHPPPSAGAESTINSGHWGIIYLIVLIESVQLRQHYGLKDPRSTDGHPGDKPEHKQGKWSSLLHGSSGYQCQCLPTAVLFTSPQGCDVHFAEGEWSFWIAH